jgi:hypothetical protein
MSETFVAILQLHDKLDLQLYTIPLSRSAIYRSPDIEQQHPADHGFQAFRLR